MGAFQCASTFRATDHRGGCNGARILNEPQSAWELNKVLVPTVKKVLDTFHERFDYVSYADLIVLAGTIAAAKMTKLPLLFCPGRSDVHDAPDSYASQRDRVNRFPPAIHDKKNILNAKASQLTFDFVKDAARIMGRSGLGRDQPLSTGQLLFEPPRCSVWLTPRRCQHLRHDFPIRPRAVSAGTEPRSG